MNDQLENKEDYDPHDHVYLWLDEPEHVYYASVEDLKSFEWSEG